MKIREEEKKDYDEVYHVIKKAFETAEHCDGNEQDLVVALRGGRAFVPELSLVAEIEGEIAGHILFTEAKVGADTVLLLAPLSVLPKYQRMGVGKALIETGHRIGSALGYSHSLVLGSEQYYPRFGYVPAEQLGVEVPEGVPPVNFMARKLNEKAGSLKGAVTYAEEFYSV